MLTAMLREPAKDNAANVYVVDDDTAVYEQLRRRAPVRWFRDPASLLRWLDSRGAGGAQNGVVVVEARLDGADGVELIDALRGRGSALPVIVLCREADVPTAVRAMQRGAVDFFARPLPAGVLLRRIRALKRSR
jgi:two-component system response regulator FixJ